MKSFIITFVLVLMSVSYGSTQSVATYEYNKVTSKSDIDACGEMDHNISGIIKLNDDMIFVNYYGGTTNNYKYQVDGDMLVTRDKSGSISYWDFSAAKNSNTVMRSIKSSRGVMQIKYRVSESVDYKKHMLP